MSDLSQTPPINYTSREFASIKQDLVSYAKRYYPDTFRDFTDASFGSMMLDMVAYVGDVISFYLDYQVNESFLDSAIEYNNIMRLARQAGFKTSRSFSSTGEITLYIIVPSSTTSGTGQPDLAYAPILKSGSKFISNSGVTFTLVDDVDFADQNNEIVVAEVNSSNGSPTSYAIKSFGKIISGELKVEYVSVGEYRRYPSYILSDDNIVEIVSIVDSQGNKYYEVDHLSQDTVYVPVKNTKDDKTLAPYVIKPLSVPRRFTVERTGRKTIIQFGQGSKKTMAQEKITDPSKVILQAHAKNYITDKTFDPTKLLETDKLGIAPSETTLTVIYRSNKANNVNIAAKSITDATDLDFSFSNAAALNQAKISTAVSSLEYENESPIVGDSSIPDVEEIRSRALGLNSAQSRAVTKQDYISLVYNMPPKFGSVKRVNLMQDRDSFKRNLNMYVISENAAGNLIQTPSTIKSNLKTWLSNYKMINDTIDIMDAKVVNLAIEYQVMIDTDENRFGALDFINESLGSFFENKYDIGEPFMYSDIFNVLKQISFVLDVKDIDVKLQTGNLYATSFFSVNKNKSADGRMIICPKDHIFEIRYPNVDIRGSIV